MCRPVGAQGTARPPSAVAAQQRPICMTQHALRQRLRLGRHIPRRSMAPLADTGQPQTLQHARLWWLMMPPDFTVRTASRMHLLCASKESHNQRQDSVPTSCPPGLSAKCTCCA